MVAPIAHTGRPPFDSSAVKNRPSASVRSGGVDVLVRRSADEGILHRVIPVCDHGAVVASHRRDGIAERRLPLDLCGIFHFQSSPVPNACQSSLLTQGNRWTYNTSVPNAAALRSKARFTPSIAVAISVTETMPMTIPSVVSTERILFARIARKAISKPFFEFGQKIHR